MIFNISTSSILMVSYLKNYLSIFNQNKFVVKRIKEKDMKNKYSHRVADFTYLKSKAMKLVGILVFLFLISTASFGQTTLFQFNFENTTNPTIDNVVGVPAFSFNGIGNTGYTFNTACQGFRMFTGDNWDTGNYYRFSVNTTGFNNLSFSFCNRTDNTSIGTFEVRVSSDSGFTWTTVLATYTPTTTNATLTTATFPISANNAATVWIEVYKVSNGANNARTLAIDSATLTSYPAPTITNLLTATSGCVGSSITINGTNLLGIPASNVKIGGTPVASITSTTTTQIVAIIGAGTTGTVSVTTSGGTATSAGVLTVNPLPTAPTLVTPSGATNLCAGSSINLNASSSGNTIYWYTVASGGASIGSSASGANFSVAPATSTTYYAESRNSNGCSSPTRTATGLITVIPTITPVVEFTQGLNDNTYTLNSSCGTISGGGQNDLDIYSGNPGGGATFQWQVSYDNGFNWVNGPGPTSTTTQYVLDPLYTIYESVSGVYKFRLIITKGGCSGTSNWITLTVNANSDLTSGAIAGNQSFCSASADPVAFTQTTAVSGGNGTYTYQWQSSTDNSTFVNIGGATATTYNSPIISQTTYFRRLVASGGCNAISNTLTVVIGIPTITIAASAITACYTSSAQTTALTYSAVTGIPITYSIAWNALPANAFVAVTNAALIASPITISIPANTAAGTYTGTITVKNASGCSSITKPFTVSINSIIPGSITGNQTICNGGNPIAFGSTAASGSGTISYQWEINTVGCGSTWNTISGATSATYDAPAGLLVTTYYRRIATSTLNSIACSDYSNCITVSVNNITASTIGSNQTFCNAIPVAFTVITPAVASGTLSYQWQKSVVNSSGPWTDILGATSATYIPVSVTQTTYYHVIVASDLNSTICTATSNFVTISEYTKTWTGLISSDWNTPNNWSPSGLPTASDCILIPSVVNNPIISGAAYNAYANNITIQNGGVLSINSSNTITITDVANVNPGGQFYIKDSASLVQINNVNNIGTFNIERITQPMYKFDYTYWGCPVTLASNFTLGNLSPDTLSDKFFSWIPTTGANFFGTWNYESYATVMNPIKGYIVRAPQTFSSNPSIKVPYTANFVGTPNNGDFYCPIYHGPLVGNNNDKYNLLGNPYASAVDAYKFLSDPINTPVIDGTIYFWTHNSPPSATYPNPFYGDYIINYSASDYASLNLLGATVTSSQALSGGALPNGFIPAGQGFFTRSTGIAASGDPVVFKNSMRVAGSNNQFFRQANGTTSTLNNSLNVIEKHRIWLNLTNAGGNFNQILVGYIEGATNGWDRNFDGVTLNDTNGITLYSIIPSQNLVIQGRPLPFDDSDQVLLGYKSNVQDTFAFRIDHFDGLFDTQNIYIEDRLLNSIHDLKQSPYVFTSAAGRFNDRFVLRYTNTTLGTYTSEAAVGIVAFVKHEKLNIQSSEIIRQIDVFDSTGKLIEKYIPIEQSKKFESEFIFAEGIYIAKIKLSNGIILDKKVVNIK